VIASLVVSTIAFFAASYFIKRWMDENEIPTGMTRSVTIFVLAAAVSYGVGWLVGLMV
jgi:VIT1/CCC1 family predicted Fe2+/Mn2+ transporter